MGESPLAGEVFILLRGQHIRRLGRKIKTVDKMGDMRAIIRHTTNDNQRNIIRLSFIIRVRARVFWGLGGSLSLEPYE